MKTRARKQERIAADKDLDNRKVDKREGYSLTKNDFTDILKAKLDGIEEHANYITKYLSLSMMLVIKLKQIFRQLLKRLLGKLPRFLIL